MSDTLNTEVSVSHSNAKELTHLPQLFFSLLPFGVFGDDEPKM